MMEATAIEAVSRNSLILLSTSVSTLLNGKFGYSSSLRPIRVFNVLYATLNYILDGSYATKSKLLSFAYFLADCRGTARISARLQYSIVPVEILSPP